MITTDEEPTREERRNSYRMYYSLNSLKGLYRGSIGAIQGDTRVTGIVVAMLIVVEASTSSHGPRQIRKGVRRWVIQGYTLGA